MDCSFFIQTNLTHTKAIKVCGREVTKVEIDLTQLSGNEDAKIKASKSMCSSEDFMKIRRDYRPSTEEEYKAVAMQAGMHFLRISTGIVNAEFNL